MKTQELEDDAFSFKFINQNGQFIEKKDEEKLRIRNIYFNEEIIKSITKWGIRISYELSEKKLQSSNIQYKIKNTETSPKIIQKPPTTNNLPEKKQEEKKIEETPKTESGLKKEAKKEEKKVEKKEEKKEENNDEELLLTISTVDEQNKKLKEIETIGDVFMKSTLKEVREKMESKLKKCLSFLDNSFKVIAEESENNVKVRDVISQNEFVFVKLMVHSQVKFNKFFIKIIMI